MNMSVVHGVIDRRILLNYRVDPDVLRGLLPSVFKPRLIDGYGMAGVCLIRLKNLRLPLVPAALGATSENAAHRIAVTWNDNGRIREGVYIPRRDTSSRLITTVGGWLFPGLHHHAHFASDETAQHFCVTVDSDDHEVRLRLEARVADGWTDGSVFASLDAASMFFERGGIGYSVGTEPTRLDGLELRCQTWNVTPLEVERLETSYFADEEVFPAGSATFDSALLMRNIPHQWHAREPLAVPLPRRRKRRVFLEPLSSS